MGKIHRENLVARLEDGEVDRHVGLRTAVRLHVNVLATEKALRPLDREALHRVHIFTAAVPPFSRITLGVLVRQAGSLRFHHRPAGEIFGRNKLDVLALTFFLRLNRVEHFRIDFAECAARPGRGSGRSQIGARLMRQVGHGVSPALNAMSDLTDASKLPFPGAIAMNYCLAARNDPHER